MLTVPPWVRQWLIESHEAFMTTHEDEIARARVQAERVKRLYDIELARGDEGRALIFPTVLGEGFIGQFSDNTAEQILDMARRARISSSTSVLDIGCGACGPAVLLASKLGCRVTGVDVSERHLARGRERVIQAKLEERVTLMHGALFDLADNLPRFDVITGLCSFGHFDTRALFSRCHDLLTPGGRIAFMDRVALGPIPSDLLHELTEDWACPAIESFASYSDALKASGFANVFIQDLSSEFRNLQERFVEVRESARSQLIEIMGEPAYLRDLAMVKSDCRAAVSGLVGYGLFLAERIDG
jgi:SAM-dependent methyltransferase